MSAQVQVTTLLLQLLFEPSFKKGFLPVLLHYYQQLLHGWSAKPQAAGTPLDMITVQLLNDQVNKASRCISASHCCFLHNYSINTPHNQDLPAAA